MADAAGSDEFFTTQWTQVERAGAEDGPERRQALAAILSRYLPALRSHLVRRMRIDSERAEDLLQEFVVRKVYEYNLFARADRARGKFRTLLLTALDNFTKDRLKRDKKQRPDSEIPDSAEDRPGPEMSFDVPWARQVLDQALTAMEENCRRENRADVWGVFQARILWPIMNGSEPTSYEALAEQFSLGSIAQAANRLVTAKRMFERFLRETVGQYSHVEDIDEEIQDLRHILAAAGQQPDSSP